MEVENKSLKKLDPKLGHIKLNHGLDRNQERALVHIATRGVVQFFNAVAERQKYVKRKASDLSGSTRAERKRILEEITEHDFQATLQKQQNCPLALDSTAKRPKQASLLMIQESKECKEEAPKIEPKDEIKVKEEADEKVGAGKIDKKKEKTKTKRNRKATETNINLSDTFDVSSSSDENSDASSSSGDSLEIKEEAESSDEDDI